MAQGHETERRLSYDRKTYQITCIVCGRTFTAKRSDASTCGPNCRKTLSRADEHRDHALMELVNMARRAAKIAQEYPTDATVFAQVMALEASVHRTADTFRLKQLALPLEVKN